MALHLFGETAALRPGLPSTAAANLQAIQEALEQAGGEFLGGDAPGVRLHQTPLRVSPRHKNRSSGVGNTNTKNKSPAADHSSVDRAFARPLLGIRTSAGARRLWQRAGCSIPSSSTGKRSLAEPDKARTSTYDTAPEDKFSIKKNGRLLICSAHSLKHLPISYTNPTTTSGWI
jgi:hypothetical protein